jgi:hypothetical protein
MAVRIPPLALERHVRDGIPLVTAWLQELGLPVDGASGEAALLEELAAALAIPVSELARMVEAVRRT